MGSILIGTLGGLALCIILFAAYLIGYKEGYHEATKFGMKKITELDEFFKKELHRG